MNYRPEKITPQAGIRTGKYSSSCRNQPRRVERAAVRAVPIRLSCRYHICLVLASQADTSHQHHQQTVPSLRPSSFLNIDTHQVTLRPGPLPWQTSVITFQGACTCPCTSSTGQTTPNPPPLHSVQPVDRSSNRILPSLFLLLQAATQPSSCGVWFSEVVYRRRLIYSIA